MLPCVTHDTPTASHTLTQCLASTRCVTRESFESEVRTGVPSKQTTFNKQTVSQATQCSHSSGQE
ncbi:hypothetical protein J6590_079340 [Homalodisca vitripennis]|nr:hypothetical protein J6590_079340 [Homalodisca vitripennis]